MRVTVGAVRIGLAPVITALRRRLPALLVLATLCTVYPSEHAQAVVECPPHDRPEVEFKRFDLIARGKLAQIKLEDDVVLARFEPSEILKGTPPDTIRLRYQGPLEAEDGDVFLLTAKSDGTYTYWFCDQYGFSADKPKHAYDVILTRYRARWTQKLKDVEANPGDIEPQLRLAHFLEISFDRPGAQSTYEQIIARWPEDGRGHAGLGRVLIAFGALEEALVSLARALELSPYDSRTLRLMQHTRMKLGQEVDYSQVDFSGLTMAGLDLSGLDLSGRDFRGALLQSANFQDAVLDGALFTGATMWGANFSGASMRGADLRYAKFYVAQFSKTDLTGALADNATFARSTFSYARLIRMHAPEASFRQAQFEHTVLGSGMYSEASFLDADFDTVDVSGSNFFQTQLGGVDLSGMDLSNTVLREAKLTRARYDCSTVFPKKNFAIKDHAMVPKQRVCHKAVQRLSFGGIDWTGYDFSGLDLRGADFRYANLSSARFNDANLERANFQGSTLRFTEFYAANLENANFSDSRLGARFSGANLKNVDFSNADGVAESVLMSGGFHRNGEFVTIGPADIAGARFDGTTVYFSPYSGAPEHLPDFSASDLTKAVIACGDTELRGVEDKEPTPAYRESWRKFQLQLKKVSALAAAHPGARLDRKCADAISRYSDERCDPWIAADQRPKGCVFPKLKR